MPLAAKTIIAAAVVVAVAVPAVAQSATPSPTFARVRETARASTARFFKGAEPEAAATVAETKPPAFARLKATAVAEDAPAPAPAKRGLFAKKAAEEAPEPDKLKRTPFTKKTLLAALTVFQAAALCAFLTLKKAPPKDEVKHPRVLRLDSPAPARVAAIAPATPEAKPPAPPPTPQELKASRKELLAKVRVVLETGGCDVEKARKAGKNMVYAAAECGNVEALTMLLAAGADVNAPAKSGETPASIAGRKGHTAAKDFLLAKGGVLKRGKSFF